jgi:hypothetical protein
MLPGFGSRSAWIHINFQNWIRIRIHLKRWIRIHIKSMRIRNTASLYAKEKTPIVIITKFEDPDLGRYRLFWLDPGPDSGLKKLPL